MSRFPLVLYYHFTLPCKELLRYEAVSPATLSLLSVSYAHTVFPCGSTLNMEAAGLLKNWQLRSKVTPLHSQGHDKRQVLHDTLHESFSL